MKIIKYYKKIKEKLQLLFNKNKKLFFATVICIILIVVVLFFPTGKSESSIENKDFYVSENVSSYCELIENKIERMLKSIAAISSADVMVMAESSPKYVYLTQTETTVSGENSTTKEEIIYEKNGSSQSPVLVSTIYPKITGVLITINKIDSSTKLSIQNAISGVLNIDSSCIFILQDR